MRAFLFLVIFSTFSLSAQTIYSNSIKGMRVNGIQGANFPLTLLDSLPVTVSFDVNETEPENFRVKIFHCDKNWNITRSSFINDEFRNYTRNRISFETAPAGVRHYRWTYSLRIPDSRDGGDAYAIQVPGMRDFEKLQYSGNYKFEIWNEDFKELVAEGKFFAAERIDNSLLTIDNRYLQSEISPKNQVNKAVLSFIIPQQQAGDINPLFSNFIKTVDVYRNREIEFPYRIDADDLNSHTFIEGFGTNDLKFIIDNMQPGNEYRRLDLSNIDLYPPDEILRPYAGADLSRWLLQGVWDSDGTSTLVTGSRYADYLQFQFELIRPEENIGEKIYIVGDFNGWKVDDRWRLQYDETKKHYRLRAWLRRGAYDYQYVLNGNDCTALEGNNWRTMNVYTALLYYHDVRFGGFDRILLAAQKKSPGGTEETSR